MPGVRGNYLTPEVQENPLRKQHLSWEVTDEKDTATQRRDYYMKFSWHACKPSFTPVFKMRKVQFECADLLRSQTETQLGLEPRSAGLWPKAFHDCTPQSPCRWACASLHSLWLKRPPPQPWASLLFLQQATGHPLWDAYPDDQAEKSIPASEHYLLPFAFSHDTHLSWGTWVCTPSLGLGSVHPLCLTYLIPSSTLNLYQSLLLKCTGRRKSKQVNE